MYSSGDGLLLHVFHHTRRWGGGRDDFLASDASDSNQKLGQKQNGCSVKTERKMEMERNVTLLRYKPGGETTPPVFSTSSGSASSLSANRWAQSIGRSALSGRQRHDKERGKKKSPETDSRWIRNTWLRVSSRTFRSSFPLRQELQIKACFAYFFFFFFSFWETVQFSWSVARSP